jgi:molybdopterin-guanine dinucleotide biosynthesis protein A
MQTPNPVGIVGLILAGGRGERLGGAIKSELVVGGQRLLDRVAGRLAACEPILLAHGRMAPELLRPPALFAPVPDLDGDYAGPLAGFAGAMAWCAAQPRPPELLVGVAVDTPFLPADYVARLVAAIGAADVAIASYAGQPYPTNAIWRVTRFLDLPARVAAGTAPHSLKRLAASMSAIDVPWPETPAGDPFANINTPEELRLMEARAATAAGRSD